MQVFVSDHNSRMNVIERDLSKRSKLLKGQFMKIMEERGESVDKINQQCLAGGAQMSVNL